MRDHPRLHGDLDASTRALARSMGVTRIARITGLDRTGIEVASAVRPGGHVLQVTNGKGLRFEEAARGALHEAAELWAAERAAPPTHLLATAGEVQERTAPGTLVISASELGGGESAEGARCAWRAAAALFRGGPAVVPLDAVHCPAGGGPVHPSWCRWTSNGMGAAAARQAALLHALLEAAERDQLARALPEGFTGEAVERRLLDPATLASAAPRAAALRRDLARRGFGVHLLDLSPSLDARERARARARERASSPLPIDLSPSLSRARARGRVDANAPRPEPIDLGLPVAAAVIVDETGGPVPVAAGYACRPTRDGALTAALLEAAQSRATEIHGAREDVAWGDRGAALPLARLLAWRRPVRSAAALPDLRVAGIPAIREVLRRFARAGFDRGAVVDLAAPGRARRGVHVVKVIVPGLLLSELLC